MIGARLKEERNRLGMTQPDFAAAAGAAKRTLIEWEKGETSPSAVQLSALEQIGVDVLYVLTGKRVTTQAPAVTSYDLATVAPLLANEANGLTWRQVLIAVVDEMTALKLRMPGATLVELVDLLMLLQKEGQPLKSEIVRGHLKLVGNA